MDDRVYPSSALTDNDESAASTRQGAFPLVQLEIVRGHAKHKFRRVSPPVFLIGSGLDCDLVLADPLIPEIHTYLFVTERGVTARRLGEGPPLRIDGKTLENGPIRDGAQLELGEYLFALHIERPIYIPDDGEPLRGPHWNPKSSVRATNELRGVSEVRTLLSDVRSALRVEAGLRFYTSEDNTWRAVTGATPLHVHRASA